MFGTYAKIIGQAGQLPAPAIDPAQIQQIQSNALALQKQQKDDQAQNALAKLYQNPANVQNGMLTQNALAQVMGIDPAIGMALQQQQFKTKDAQISVAADQQSYLASTVLTPAMEAYQDALKTMPQAAAMQVAQQVYSASLGQAKSSGVFSSDQADQMPQDFNPARVSSNLETYAQYQKQQDTEQALLIRADEGGGKKRGPVAVPGLNAPYGGGQSVSGGAPEPSPSGGATRLASAGETDASPPGLPSVPGLTSGAADVLYQNYVSTGTMPTFGNSKASQAQKDAFLNYVAARNAQPSDASAAPDPIATAIANYDMQISPYMMRTPSGRKIMNNVLAINPNYDATQYSGKNATVQAFDKGPQGNSVRSLDVGIQHLGVLEPLVTALNNGDVQTVNRLGNALSSEFGGTAPTNFDTTKQIVADEIAKAIVGGQTAQADREKASDLLSSAESPAQLNGAIDQIKKLMAGQLAGLRQQYTSSTGLPDSAFESKLLPVTRQQLEGVSGGADQSGGSVQTPPPPAVGTVMQGYKFNGGNPADPSSWSKV